MAEGKHAGGRPTKLSPDITDRIVNAIRAGAYVETAAEFAGLNKTTFYDWLKRGAKDREAERDSPFAQFAHAIEKAMADSELMDLGTIGLFAKGFPVEKVTVVVAPDPHTGEMVERERKTETTIRREWTAAAWRLERKHPRRWGRRMELSGPDGESLGLPVVIYLPQKDAVSGTVTVKGNGGDGDGDGKKESATANRFAR
jgi:hypothetical protein